ncbi:unnamed protein product [Schistosoma turkestanicum]|nr:unnamed protein product [Schistosoma turkestanicum]
MDYFGIEYDQKVEEIKHQENKRKALLSSSSSSTVSESSTGSNLNLMEQISSTINNDYNKPSLIISKPKKVKTAKKHTLQSSTTTTTTSTTNILSKSNINRTKAKLVDKVKTDLIDENLHGYNNDDLLEFEENLHHHDHKDDVEYGADALKIIRQRTGLNLYTGTTLDIPSNKKKSSIPVKLDSQGYRVPDEDPYKFDLLTEEEAATVLYKSIIEIRENVIIMNKPRGIASQPGNDCKYNIVDLLPCLESIIRKRNHCDSKVEQQQQQQQQRIDELSTVHRLDKDSSGIMLIARNRDAALKLQEAFARRWIKKDYLCITVGIPRSDYGYIQLPLIERNFNGIRKMCTPQLNRHLQELTCQQTQLDVNNELNEYDVTDAFSVLYDKMQTNNNQPTTWYHLIDKQNNAALLQCSTLTGIKHQVRAHLAFGLQTPILGDHKYSHAEYLAPQRLPKCLLEALHVRQSKVRYLSLHLHASTLHLHLPSTQSTSLNFSSSSSSSSNSSNEGFFDFIRPIDHSHRSKSINNNSSSKNPLKFYAPLPNHFRENLKRIGLKLPHYLKCLH